MVVIQEYITLDKSIHGKVRYLLRRENNPFGFVLPHTLVDNAVLITISSDTDTKLIGYMYITHQDDYTDLSSIYIDKSNRRLGYATMLLDYFEKQYSGRKSCLPMEGSYLEQCLLKRGWIKQPDGPGLTR